MSYKTDLESINTKLNSVKTNCNTALGKKGVSAVSSLSKLPNAINSIVALTKLTVKSGTATVASTRVATLSITHGLGKKPSYVFIKPNSYFTVSQYQQIYSSGEKFYEQIVITPGKSYSYCCNSTGYNQYEDMDFGGAGTFSNYSLSTSTISITSGGGYFSNIKSYEWIAIG